LAKEQSESSWLFEELYAARTVRDTCGALPLTSRQLAAKAPASQASHGFAMGRCGQAGHHVDRHQRAAGASEDFVVTGGWRREERLMAKLVGGFGLAVATDRNAR